MGNVFVRGAAALGAALLLIAWASGAPRPAPATAAQAGMPADIAVAPEVAEVRVAVAYNPVVEGGRFDLDGQLLAPLRIALLAPPIDVAVNGRTGDLYVLRRWQGNLHLDHYTPANALDRQWETGFTASPVALAVDDRTGLVSAVLTGRAVDGVRGEILGFDASGALQESWSAVLPSAPIAFGRDADLATYLALGDDAGRGSVRKFRHGGVPQGEWTLDARPLAVGVGGNDVFVAGVATTGEPVVHRFDRDGATRGGWWLGGRPLAVDVGPDDHVYVLVQRGLGLDLAAEKYTSGGVLVLRAVVLARTFLPGARLRR